MPTEYDPLGILAETGDPVATGAIQDPVTSDPSFYDPLQGMIEPAPSFAMQPTTLPDPQEDDFTFEPSKSIFEAGIDMAHAQFYKGISAAGQVAGEDGLVDWAEENAEINLKDATVPIEGLMDKVVFAAGQVSATVPAILGAAAVAPYVGLSAATGGTVAAGLASLGMTTGDLQMKAEGLDAEHAASMGQLLTGAVLAAPDAFAIGRLRTLLQPIGELVTESVKGTLKASRGVSAAGKIAATAGGIGVAEGLQDLGTGLGANYFTGKEIDQSRIAALAESFKEEAIVGSILGLPMGGANVYVGQMAEAQADFDTNKKMKGDAERIPEDGTFNPDAEWETLVPVDGAAKQPGFFSLAWNTLTGNATDVLKVKNKGNPYIQGIAQQFNLTPNERAPGKLTVSEMAQREEAKDISELSDFYNATLDEQNKAAEAQMNGTPMDTPAYKSLNNYLTKVMPEKASSMTDGEIDTSQGLWTDSQYFPTFLALDMKKMAEDPNIQNLAEQNLQAQGLDPTSKEYKKAMATLARKMHNWRTYGSDLHYGTSRSKSRVETMLTKIADGDKKATPKLKGILKGMQKRRSKDIRESPLTLDRELAAFTQDFFTPFYDKNKSAADVMRQHVRQMNEHLSIAQRFGVDGQRLDEGLAKAIVYAKANGLKFDSNDVARTYDVLRTAQRIHLRPMSQTLREGQNKVRAATNMMLLGLAVLVSIPESLVISLNTGGGATLKGLAQTVGVGKENALAADDLGLGLAQSMNHVTNRTAQESFEIGVWEQRFFKVTGLPHLQHFLSVWAARSQDVYIRRLLTQLGDNKLSGPEAIRAQNKLWEAGIDVERAQNWRVSGYDPQDAFFRDSYVPAIQRLVKDTIVDPSPIDKPLWMNDERFMLIAQLKGFMTAFTNRVMRGWAQKIQMAGPEGNRVLATKLAPYVAAYLAAQIGIQAVRELATGGNLDDWDEKGMTERVWKAFGYLGAMGWFVDLINAMRWRSDPLIGVVPALSVANRTVGDTVRAMEASDPEAALAKATFRNLTPNAPFKDLIIEAWAE